MKEVRFHNTTIKESQDLRDCEGMVLTSAQGSVGSDVTVAKFSEAPKHLMTPEEQHEFMDAVRQYVVERDNYHSFDDVIQMVVNRAFKPIIEGLDETPQG